MILKQAVQFAQAARKMGEPTIELLEEARDAGIEET